MSDFSFFVARLPEAVASATPPEPTKGALNNGARLNHKKAMVTRARIVDTIKQHPGIGICELADKLNVTRQTVNHNLRALRDAGQIHRLPGYFGGYSITVTCKKY